MEKKFYVYEWYNKDTNKVFYVGKGCGKRNKDLSHRNELFLEYYNNNNCDVRIVKYFDNENEAFAYEEILIESYKSKGQAQCSIAKGGYGGYSIIWTDELKQYWSENNPMKDEKQRQRMRENNPMYNPEVAKKNANAHKRAVNINYIHYDGVKDAAEALGVTTVTIQDWCKKGYNSKWEPCRYEDEEQKPFEKKPVSWAKAVIVDGEHYFESAKDACIFLGAKDSSAMIRAMKAGRLYKGHKCEYANQQPS